MKEPINPSAAQPSSRCRVHHRRTVLPRAMPGMVWPKSRESEADIGSAKGRSANALRERAPPDRAHASWVANATDARAPAARGPNSAESVSPARELTGSGRGGFCPGKGGSARKRSLVQPPVRLTTPSSRVLPPVNAGHDYGAAVLRAQRWIMLLFSIAFVCLWCASGEWRTSLWTLP